MDRFFSMDNKFFSAMSRVGDLMILNLLTMLLCIPVVTIGPALTALFYMCLKMVRNEETYIVKGYFSSFKQNARQGIVINLILLVLGGFLLLDFYIVQTQLSGTVQKVMFCLMIFVLLIYLMVFTYVYPVLAKFYNSIKNTFLNAFLMSLRHLPYTLLMIAITAVPIAAFFSGVEQVQSIALLLIILFGISGVAFLNSHFLVKIFDNYIPKEEEAPVSDLDFTLGEIGEGAFATSQGGSAAEVMPEAIKESSLQEAQSPSAKESPSVNG